jgi:hypothetical protein
MARAGDEGYEEKRRRPRDDYEDDERRPYDQERRRPRRDDDDDDDRPRRRHRDDDDDDFERRHPRHSKKGLIIGLTIAGSVLLVGLVIGGIVIVWVGDRRDGERRQTTHNNLRQVGVATHTAVGDYKRIPPTDTRVGTGRFGGQGNGAYGAKTGNMFYHLLPYVEQMPMYNAGNGSVSGLVPAYHAPSDPTDTSAAAHAAGTCFPANANVFNQGGNIIGKNLTTSMPDGTSNCLAFAMGSIKITSGFRNCGMTSNEGNLFAVGNAWSENIMASTQFAPAAIFQLPGSPAAAKIWDVAEGGIANNWQAYGTDGISVCMGDANTRVVSPNVSLASWKNAVIPNDNMNPGADF